MSDQSLYLADGMSAIVVDAEGEPVVMMLAETHEGGSYTEGPSLIASLFVALREHPQELSDFIDSLPAVKALQEDDDDTGGRTRQSN